MPCYRCGARQADPEQGKPSPWKRGVRREHQVLICPDCFSAALEDLDRCPGCGGTHLIRRLDQVECLSCGQARDVSPEPESSGVNPVPEPSAPARGPASSPGTLADEVSEALGRLFR